MITRYSGGETEEPIDYCPLLAAEVVTNQTDLFQITSKEAVLNKRLFFF